MTHSALQTFCELTPSKPFLKWAGGKSKLLPHLLRAVPLSFGRYFEPFVGGGALFYALRPNSVTLTDINFELINTYQVVRDDVEKLIAALSRHVYKEDYFYKVRDADRSPEYLTWSLIEKAARFIYLNRTCFNGLYRVSSHGFFNVPFGSYKDPIICNKEVLRSCSHALQGVELGVRSFEEIITQVKADDFVYFDPPYAPVSKTANFTNYSKEGFGVEKQELLRDLCRELSNKKVKFLLSNSYSESMLELYNNSGFFIDIVESPRSINSKGALRKKIKEILVRNYR